MLGLLLLSSLLLLLLMVLLLPLLLANGLNQERIQRLALALMVSPKLLFPMFSFLLPPREQETRLRHLLM